MTQSEAELEQQLIERLTTLGYEPVTIRNAEDLKANLKTQLEKHNHIKLSDTEFKTILNHLDKGNVFDRAKRLRDKMELNRDDGTTFYLEFINTEHWCQNQCQVTNQTDTSNRSHSCNKLNEFIADYNQMYKTQHSARDSQAFYAYYKDISKRNYWKLSTSLMTLLVRLMRKSKTVLKTGDRPWEIPVMTRYC